MENFEDDNRELDLRELLEKLSDTEIGQKVERALYRLKTAMEKVSEKGDMTELGKRCYADLSQARLALGEDGHMLDPFFAMFHGIFTTIDESELDPDYQYDETEDNYEPEFTVLGIIPIEGDGNPLPEIKENFREKYPQYTIISNEEGLGIRDRLGSEEENHFFVQSPEGTLVSISITEEEDKLKTLEPLIENTEGGIPDEIAERFENNHGRYLEIYLAPETGITISENLSPDGLSNQMEKAEMAVRLSATALENFVAISIFTNGRMYRPEEYIQMVEDLDTAEFMPADLFAYTYIEKVEDDENAIMTMGLSNFGFLEMIAITSDDDLEREEMFCAIQDLVNYVLQRGTAIQNGEVISFDSRTRYSFTFEDLNGQPVFRVRRLRPDDDVDVFSMLSEFHGPISWNRYEGLTCPLSFYWNEKKTVLLFHIPGCEASYEGYMSEYTYLLDNLSFIFEGIKDFFMSPECMEQKAIRSYMRGRKVPKEDWEKKLLELKPTDIFLDPTVDSIKEGSPMLTVRYRERKNSRSFIEIGIDSDVKLSGIASI